MYQHSALGALKHPSGMKSLLVSEIGQEIWKQTTVMVGNCMIRGVGSNQSAADLCSFPGSHLYHIEPNKTPDVSETISMLGERTSMIQYLGFCLPKNK